MSTKKRKSFPKVFPNGSPAKFYFPHFHPEISKYESENDIGKVCENILYQCHFVEPQQKFDYFLD